MKSQKLFWTLLLSTALTTASQFSLAESLARLGDEGWAVSAGDHYCPGNSDIAIVCRMVNKARAAHGLRPLKMTYSLNAMAASWAAEMNRRKVLSHDEFESRRHASGALRENVSWRGVNNTPTSVMRGLMNSSGHRANILCRSCKEFGGGHSGGYWAQSFK